METTVVKLRSNAVKIQGCNTTTTDDSCCNATPSPRPPPPTQRENNLVISLADVDIVEVSETDLQTRCIHVCNFETLPETVLMQVLSYLSAFELLQLSAANNRFRQLILNRWELWRNLLRGQQGLKLFKYRIFVKPQIHCNHCSAGAFQTSPTCPSQALNFPKETRDLLGTIENPDWLRGYIKTYGLNQNWMSGRYHPISSRCHTKHVTGVVATQNSVLSCGKDGYVFMYSRDFFVHYKLISMDCLLCMQLIGQSMICLVDTNGFLHLVNVPPKLPSNPTEPPVSKFWTCPIADTDTKSLILSDLEQFPTEFSESFCNDRENLQFVSLLAICVSHHSSVSVIRIVFNLSQSETDQKESWPNLDSVVAVDLVQRFTLATDDTERVFLFSCGAFDLKSELDSDKMLFVSSYECPVVIYHLMTATCLLKVSNVCDVCYCGTFDPSRNTFYTGGADGKLVVWKFNVVDKDAESGTTSSTSSHQSSAATTSEQLCENMSVSLWCERVMDHPPEVYCLAYFTHPHTADEVHLVSGGSDGDIRVWYLETGHLLRVLTGHVGIVRKLVIQRGRQLISTGDQRRIIIWNLSVAKTMQSVIATNSSESTDRKQLLFRSDPQRVLQPLITDAGIDSEKEAIVLHRNPISIDSLFVDDFSVFIGSPDYPGSVGAILFW